MSDRERYFLTGLPLGVLIGLVVLCVLTRTLGQTAAEVFEVHL